MTRKSQTNHMQNQGKGRPDGSEPNPERWLHNAHGWIAEMLCWGKGARPTATLRVVLLDKTQIETASAQCTRVWRMLLWGAELIRTAGNFLKELASDFGLGCGYEGVEKHRLPPQLHLSLLTSRFTNYSIIHNIVCVYDYMIMIMQYQRGEQRMGTPPQLLFLRF